MEITPYISLSRSEEEIPTSQRRTQTIAKQGLWRNDPPPLFPSLDGLENTPAPMVGQPPVGDPAGSVSSQAGTVVPSASEVPSSHSSGHSTSAKSSSGDSCPSSGSSGRTNRPHLRDLPPISKKRKLVSSSEESTSSSQDPPGHISASSKKRFKDFTDFLEESLFIIKDEELGRPSAQFKGKIMFDTFEEAEESWPQSTGCAICGCIDETFLRDLLSVKDWVAGEPGPSYLSAIKAKMGVAASKRWKDASAKLFMTTYLHFACHHLLCEPHEALISVLAPVKCSDFGGANLPIHVSKSLLPDSSDTGDTTGSEQDYCLLTGKPDCVLIIDGEELMEEEKRVIFAYEAKNDMTQWSTDINKTDLGQLCFYMLCHVLSKFPSKFPYKYNQFGLYSQGRQGILVWCHISPSPKPNPLGKNHVGNYPLGKNCVGNYQVTFRIIKDVDLQLDGLHKLTKMLHRFLQDSL